MDDKVYPQKRRIGFGKVRVLDSKEQATVSVSIDARSWEGASEAMLSCYRNTPPGYTLIACQISRRGKKGGRRCQVRFLLRQTKEGYPEITQKKAVALFRAEIEQAGYKPECAIEGESPSGV